MSKKQARTEKRPMRGKGLIGDASKAEIGVEGIKV